MNRHRTVVRAAVLVMCDSTATDQLGLRIVGAPANKTLRLDSASAGAPTQIISYRRDLNAFSTCVNVVM